DPQDEPSGGLSSTLVQKLPQFKTSKPARPDGSECVVCLDGFRKGRWCRRLPGCGPCSIGSVWTLGSSELIHAQHVELGLD
ncbi:unnamed protein product, partial [Brassica napus]